MLTTGDKIKHHFTIDAQKHSEFISLSGDHNPLHTTDDFAKKHGFLSIVMHGNILNCFVSFLIGELLPVKNVLILSQEINFTKPVYLNETVTLNAEIIAYFEFIPGYEIKFKFVNQATNEAKASGKVLIKII